MSLPSAAGRIEPAESKVGTFGSSTKLLTCDYRPVTDPADLGVVDSARALRSGALSSRELVESCLARIGERDGAHSHDGDPGSVNAWVRVYEEDALEAAARADARLAAGDAPELCGIPVGLKDLYA